MNFNGKKMINKYSSIVRRIDFVQIRAQKFRTRPVRATHIDLVASVPQACAIQRPTQNYAISCNSMQ